MPARGGGGGGGVYIGGGDLTEGFLRYRFRGLVFGGAYTRRSLFSEFYDIFYPDSCGRHLKPSLESGLKTMRFRWPDWLVSCGRKADPCKKSMRFQKYPDSYGRILNKIYTFHDGLTDTILEYFTRGRRKYKLRRKKVDTAVCFLRILPFIIFPSLVVQFSSELFRVQSDSLFS